MSSKNDVTGDSLRTKIGNKKERKQYAENYDKIEKPNKDDPYWKKYFEDKDNAK